MKLTIELIPSTAWFKNIRSYVKQSEWDKIRKYVYKQSGYKCDICGGKGHKHPVECHEIWDFKDGIIELKGLTSLCPSCHQVKHIGLAFKNGRLDYAKKHLMKVNKISSQEADDYIFKSFEIFEERSNQDWILNLDMIDNYLEKVLK